MVDEGLAFVRFRVLPTPASDLRDTAHPSLPPPSNPLQSFSATTGKNQVAKACWPHSVRGDHTTSALHQAG